MGRLLAASRVGVMQYRRLGKTGLEVSVIGFGCFPLLKMPVPEVRVLVAGALSQGINFLDASGGAQESESRVGAAIEDRRDEVVLATKSAPLSAREAKSDVLRACQRLKVETIDLYQIEGVNRPARLETVLEPGGALEGLRRERDAGRVRHIGLSGYNCDLLREALERSHDLETVQFPFNILEDDPPVRLLMGTAAARAVGTIAMKPLAGGVLPKPIQALRWVLNQPVSTVSVSMASADEVTADAAVGAHPEPLTQQEEADLRRQVAAIEECFCRRCMLCEPCPQGIPIYQILELGQKAALPHMAALARELYDMLQVKADACAECGECLERCPYRYPVREMLQAAHRLLTG